MHYTVLRHGNEVRAKSICMGCLLEISDMIVFRWMLGIKRIEKIRSEEIRARAGVTNISEKIREG